MKREDIIAMAREAEFHVSGQRVLSPVIEGTDLLWLLERFAALVAAAERDKFNKERQQYADWFDEAAADIADWGGYASEYFQSKHGLDANVQDFKNRAAAIRARGETK
jgi:hypothetical protein